MKDKIIEKLTSRKLWLAVAGFVAMLVVALGGAEEVATQVAAIIMAGATVIAYIVGEGLVDSKTEDSEMDGASFDDYSGATVTNNYTFKDKE